jgi:nitroreductase
MSRSQSDQDRIVYPDSRLDDALARLQERRSVKAMDLCEPGPSDAELEALLSTGIRVPDHGKLGPWRLIKFSGQARQVFGDVLAERFATLNPEAREHSVAAERDRFMRAPVVIGVIARITPGIKIPEWEQQMSVGAVCQNILVTANLMGFAAQWLTEWYAFDEQIDAALGLTTHERVAGFIYIGSAKERPTERVRPELADVLSNWQLP